ncbi:hypothetical protein ACRAWF_43485 [Streptomyces sp. L7]
MRLSEGLELLGAVGGGDTRLQVLPGGVQQPGPVRDGLDLQEYCPSASVPGRLGPSTT